MVLSSQQVKARIKKPVNKAAIDEADRHEQRIKLHAKAVDHKDKAPAYFNDFLTWVSSDIALPADKMKVFKGLCQFPLSTNALTSSIFLEHEKVFSAQDSYFDVELLDDTMKAEFKGYLEKKKIREVFQSKAFDVYCKRPASLFVIDLPAEQTTLRPEPYFYTVAISSIVDIDIEKTLDGERVGSVIFKAGKRFIQIDDQYYRVFEKQQDSDEPAFIGESLHGLGYTPACFLPIKPLYDEEDKSPVARKTILSNVLSDLDWLQFWKVAERMVNTYGPFPIWTVPKTDCSYVDATSGNPCQLGVISITNSRGESSYMNCPVCEKNNLVGPGTVYEKPVPRTKEQPELGNAVDITTPDVVNLEYIAKQTDYLEREIYANCVGSYDESITKEAVNEKQVIANVEGQKAILLNLKKEFEACEKFIIDTMGRLMYRDYYVTSTVNLGEQFMLYTAQEVVDQFQIYKKAGLPNYMVAQKKQLLLQTENRNNPYEQRRAEILNMLEPWPDLSLSETVNLQLANTFKEKFALKLDFAKFVSKFELVNGDIVQWGSALSMDQKIKRITQILFNYVKEESATAEPAGTQSANADGTQAARA